jgi:hypothetical protein
LTQALWFSKLGVFIDALEGTIPEPARAQMKSQHRDMEEWFQDEEMKQQVRRFAEVNEDDGRELIVANCWFIGERESQEMWNNYVNNDEGVAIRSTARDLAKSLSLSHKNFWMGRVHYVDRAKHSRMNTHEAHQAHLRAFLKSEQYAFENELRVAPMNWVAPGCLNPDGSPQTEKQKSGLVYSGDRRGILVCARLPMLIKEVRTAPGASEWHRNLIKLLLTQASIPCSLVRSELAGR